MTDRRSVSRSHERDLERYSKHVADWLVDPEAIAEEYASEEALQERWAAYDEVLEGPGADPHRAAAASARRWLGIR